MIFFAMVNPVKLLPYAWMGQLHLDNLLMAWLLAIGTNRDLHGVPQDRREAFVCCYLSLPGGCRIAVDS